MTDEITVFWFRRDLRLHDNTALYRALNAGLKVLPVFIFDEEILNELPKDDARVSFIYQTLHNLHQKLQQHQSSLFIAKDRVEDTFQNLHRKYNIRKIFLNKDYEPYAIKRDKSVYEFCQKNSIEFHAYKDQVIFEENEVVKADKNPYTVYTPYKNRWRERYKNQGVKTFPSENFIHNFVKTNFDFPSMKELGFIQSNIEVKKINKEILSDYHQNRDIPTKSTSNTSVYLRFGLISIRKLFKYAETKNTVYSNELIWREFFMQILWHFPKVVNENFKKKYNFIPWRNDDNEFKMWCDGKTGYPIVDAGMNELNKTGYMHNRVRMITASFLCKHLLIDWRWGEAYFAKKLLDYDLAANNGNWQWVAGTGCDSAPYFRVFNPTSQQEKFDRDFEYIKKWNPNYKSIPKIVEHKFARERYLQTMKANINF